MRAPAIFLDRDGTLVYPRHYPSRPEELQLYQGIGPGLRRVQRAGFKLVVITNQSDIARGLYLEHNTPRPSAVDTRLSGGRPRHAAGARDALQPTDLG